MTFEYIPRGVCSRKIIIDVEDDKVLDVKFIGGCNGNLKGIGALVKGMTVDEVITRLEGIDCNMKGTSCPDQLAMALKSINK
ncbi:MAG: TIGR03905 family TSCPD domain-containing protein [Ruminiclostridium sp.]